MLKTQQLLLISAAALLAAACSDTNEQIGSVHVKSADIEASVGGQIEVTKEDYEPLAGTRVIIPAKALAANTRITIGIGPESITDGDGDAIGIAVEFGPPGTNFAHPVELKIPITEAVDEDLLRVYVQNADGTREVILPYDVQVDGSHIRFYVSHFTSFQPGRARGRCRHVMCPSGQCRRGRCEDPCNAMECGPQPGVPSWTCEDGTAGGSTGECNRNPDGTCGWEIIWCERICEPSECGPAPGAPNFMCPDGTVGGPVCSRGASGVCGWDHRSCEGNGCLMGQMCNPGEFCDPMSNTCVPDICTLIDCAEGYTCVPGLGACVPDMPEQCGDVTCGPGTYCCNSSCGICAPLDGACTQQACEATCGGPMDPTCDPGFTCEMGVCVEDGIACGPNTCYGDTVCCNSSCGICTPPDGVCIQLACDSCDGVVCNPGEVCNPMTVQCEPDPSECTPMECGPQPGVPSWTCDDGTPGGSTGVCQRHPDGTCGWEVIWCEMACGPMECGAPPPFQQEPCTDGTVVAPECRRDPFGTMMPRQCIWTFPGCPGECAAADCGPLPPFMVEPCADGSIPAPICRADPMTMMCGWDLDGDGC